MWGCRCSLPISWDLCHPIGTREADDMAHSAYHPTSKAHFHLDDEYTTRSYLCAITVRNLSRIRLDGFMSSRSRLSLPTVRVAWIDPAPSVVSFVSLPYLQHIPSAFCLSSSSPASASEGNVHLDLH